MDFFEVEVEQLSAFGDYLVEVSGRPRLLADHLITHVCTPEPYGVGALAPIGDFLAGRATGWVERFERVARERVLALASGIDASAHGYATAEATSVRLVAGVGW